MLRHVVSCRSSWVGLGWGIGLCTVGCVHLPFFQHSFTSFSTQVTVLRTLLVTVRGGGGGGSRGLRYEQDAGAPSPAELNSGVHVVLLPLLLDAIAALPACSPPQVQRAFIQSKCREGGSSTRQANHVIGFVSFHIPHTTQQNAAIDLLAEVGAMHMTVPQLRRLLRLLQPHADDAGDDDDRPARCPAHLSRLLRCLGRMVGEERFPGPSHYLWMDGGPHAGVRLRPLAGFSRRHYSFVSWIQLEDETGGGSLLCSSSYRPYLFSLVAEDGTALDAYFLPSSSGGGAGGSGRCYTLQLEYRRNKVRACVCAWIVWIGCRVAWGGCVRVRAL